MENVFTDVFTAGLKYTNGLQEFYDTSMVLLSLFVFNSKKLRFQFLQLHGLQAQFFKISLFIKSCECFYHKLLFSSHECFYHKLHIQFPGHVHHTITS